MMNVIICLILTAWPFVMEKKHSYSTILALDTCTEACSVALTVDGRVFSEFCETPREHSQRLLPMVDKVFEQAGITLSHVDVIAYGRGPGSFTGIRICTSMTQGLALAHNIPVVGISTLVTIAQHLINQGAKQVLAAIDARMGEIYWGQFIDCQGVATLVGEEQVSTPENIKLIVDNNHELVCAGTAFETYPDLLAIANNMVLVPQARLPKAQNMLQLAVRDIEMELATSVDNLAPVYLRDKVTWKKLPGRE